MPTASARRTESEGWTHIRLGLFEVQQDVNTTYLLDARQSFNEFPTIRASATVLICDAFVNSDERKLFALTDYVSIRFDTTTGDSILIVFDVTAININAPKRQIWRVGLN